MNYLIIGTAILEIIGLIALVYNYLRIKRRQDLTDHLARHDTTVRDASSSPDKFRAAFENAPLGIYQNTLDGKVIRVNQKLAEIFGAPSPEFLVNQVADLAKDFYVYPEERIKMIQAAIESDDYVMSELLEKRLDGTVITVRSKMRAVRDESGVPLYFEGFLEDITEQKKALEELNEAAAFNDLARQMLSDFASCSSCEITSQISIALERISRFVGVDCGLIAVISDDRSTVSREYQYLTSDTGEQLDPTISMPLQVPSSFEESDGLSGSRGSIDDFSIARAVEIVSSHLDTGCESGLSIPILRADGLLNGILKIGSLAATIELKESEVNRLRVFAEAVANVLQRARAEQAVLASEHNYRSIFENAPLGIFQSSVDGRLISINEQLAKFMHYPSAAEAVAAVTNLREQVYVDSEDRDNLIQDLLASTGFIKKQTRLFRKDHSIFNAEISLRLVRDIDGHVMYLEGFIEDITTAKAAEASLQRRFEIDKLITKIVASFATCDIADVDSSINSALQSLAMAFGAEHAYILSVVQDGASYTASYEWTEQDIVLMKSEYNDTPFGTAPWTEQMLMSDQVVNIKNLTEYPYYENPEVSRFASNKGRISTLAVPIYGKDGVTAGAICLASYSKEVVWTDSDIAKMRIAGDAIAGVVDRKRVDELARKQKQYDSLIRSTLERFAVCAPSEIDNSVELALKDAASCFGGERIFLNLFNSDLSSYNCTHEWLQAGYGSMKEKFQNVKMGTFPTIEGHVLANQVYRRGKGEVTEDVDSVTPGPQSSLFVPVYGVCETIIGMLGLVSFTCEISWTDKDVDQIRVVGNAIVNAIERKKADIALKHSAAFDELMAALLAGFATCNQSDFDRTVNNALYEIATYIGAQQGYLVLSAPDGLTYSCVNEWCADGVPPLKEFIQDVPYGTWRWTEEQLANDRSIQYTAPEDLPDEAVQEKTCPVFDMGYVSSIIVPINGDVLKGSIAISSFQKAIVWEESDVRHLKVVGDAIAGMIDRQKAESEIRTLNASLERRISERTVDLEEARRSAIRIMHEVDEQRRRAERALAKLELTTEQMRLLSQAVDNSPAMVLITDDSLHIEYVNPKFTEVTGYTREEVVGKDPVFAPHNADVDESNRSLLRALAEGKEWSGEISSCRKSGQVFWEYASFAPIKTVEGAIRHYVAVKEDITERRAMQDELRLARDAAETANRTKSLFLANMSHEIRTPMNAILGFSQLLQSNHTFRDKEKQHLDIINRSGEHLLALINDILEMSKIEAGRVELNRGIVDLLALINDVSVMYRMRCADKNINFSLEQVGQLPEYVHTDENKLRQILTNLLGNAVKLTDQGSVVLRVSIAATRFGGSCIIVDVEDTGPGIAEEEREKVFRPFEQTASGIRSRSGTGLGLAISLQFAHVLGGDITFKSKVNKGTTFQLIAPVDIVASSKLPVISSNMAVVGLAPGCRVKKVLVVDDEAENRILMCSMLHDAGFETNEAAEGISSLLLFKSWRPDVILMDAQMPQMDGYDAIRRIRRLAKGRSVPIIGVSASAFDEDRRRMLDAGADDFLPKPIRMENLYSAIGAASGATYRYADRGGAASVNSEQTNFVDFRRNIALIPIEISSKIKQATIDADFDTVIELVDKIPELDREAADALRSMAEQYEATKIISLLSPD